MARNPHLDWSQLDDVILGCANQAGEDNRNVARMAVLLSGLPDCIPGSTVNRLCGSGLDAIAIASRAVRSGEANLVIAGGVESMTRAPFVLGKSEVPFSRAPKLEDTTLGWRFVNPAIRSAYGVDSMIETAENVAEEFNISRSDQDRFAYRSQQRAAYASAQGWLAEEITAVSVPQKNGDLVRASVDEQPRKDTTLEALEKLKPLVKESGTVTAGNASGINDGAAALLIGSARGVKEHQLSPIGRVVASAVAGVQPRIMGIGPIPAVRKVLAMTALRIEQMDVIELNEAFAAQALAVLRAFDIPDDSDHVNPSGGAIALGHPLGASGARLVLTALHHLRRTGGRYGLCTMCIGVGQGIALVVERV
jgi:acetyl-CoA acyltransferase